MLTLVRVTYAHVWAWVAGWVGEEEKHAYCCYAYQLYFLTCDMYKSSLRHIHDLVLSSLKMKGILSFMYTAGCLFSCTGEYICEARNDVANCSFYPSRIVFNSFKHSERTCIFEFQTWHIVEVEV
jgi:hypothetical protein